MCTEFFLNVLDFHLKMKHDYIYQNYETNKNIIFQLLERGASFRFYTPDTEVSSYGPGREPEDKMVKSNPVRIKDASLHKSCLFYINRKDASYNNIL